MIDDDWWLDHGNVITIVHWNTENTEHMILCVSVCYCNGRRDNESKRAYILFKYAVIRYLIKFMFVDGEADTVECGM